MRRQAIPLHEQRRHERLRFALTVAGETIGLVLAFAGMLILWLLVVALFAPDAALHLGVQG